MPHHGRTFIAPLRIAACGLIVLLFLPANVRAEDAAQLVAGEPLVLSHPQINKSVGNPVLCLTFVDDGALLATGATSGVLIWDARSGELRQTLEVDERAVDAITLDPRGALLIAGGASGVVKVFDARTFKLKYTLGPAPGAIQCLAVTADGKLLASVSPYKLTEQADAPFGIHRWDLATGEQLPTIPHPTPAFGAISLAVMPDGKQLITAQDRTLRIFDVQQGKELKSIELPDLPQTLASIALRGDGKRLVTGAFEPKLRLWDTESWRQTLAWDAHTEQPPPRRGVSCVAFSPDGRYVLSGGMDGMVCVWDASTGRRLLELDGRGEVSARWITGVAMTAKGDLLAASHYGGSATIWRISEPK